MDKIEKLLEMSDYRGNHTAPGKSSGTQMDRADDIWPDDIYSSKAVQYYGHGAAEYSDRESIAVIQAARGKPNHRVKIYRAVPDVNAESRKKIDFLREKTGYFNQFGFFKSGDEYIWKLRDKYDKSDLDYDAKQQAVVDDLERQVAKLERQQKPDLKIQPGDWVTQNRRYAVAHGKAHLDSYKILTKTVRASDLYTDANSIHEWGYSP